MKKSKFVCVGRPVPHNLNTFFIPLKITLNTHFEDFLIIITFTLIYISIMWNENSIKLRIYFFVSKATFLPLATYILCARNFKISKIFSFCEMTLFDFYVI